MAARLALVILLGWLVAACGGGTPDIEVADRYDLGTVIKGAHAVAELPVRNTGDAPLTVAAISTSCGCTKATLIPMTIPPGGEGRLRIDYDSAAHAEDMGRLERLVFISSDDPDEEEVRITISVVVAPARS